MRPAAWPTSDRNTGRLQVGIAGRLQIGIGGRLRRNPHKLVRDLQSESGIASRTIASFLKSTEHLLAGSGSLQRRAAAFAAYNGSVIIVDEASMISNVDKEKLVDFANRLEVARLVFVGDKRQLGAIDAGKPFEVLQRTQAAETALMNENLRQRDPVFKAAVEAANAGNIVGAMKLLQPMMVEAGDQAVERAADQWLSLPAAERDSTLIFASGRRVRTQINDLVQASRKGRGELGANSLDLIVLDRVGITREEERYVQSYEPGMRVDLRNGVPSQNIPAGAFRVVRIDRDRQAVTLEGEDGRQRIFRPFKLSPTRQEDSVQLSRDKKLTIHEGDRIRWTENDKERGLLNADQARILGIGKEGVTVETATKMVLTLPHGDPMLARLDLSYAINAHMAQGVTADRGIAVMDSRERNLSNERLFLVTISRMREPPTLLVDNIAKLTGQIMRNSGDKTSALETVGRLPQEARPASTPMPSMPRPGAQPSPRQGAATTGESGKAAPKPELERKPSPNRQLSLDL